MIKIGLTGSIGMGKTETGKIFSELGFPVYNADDAVHKLYGPGQKGSEKIKEIFPNSINPDGSVNREILKKFFSRKILIHRPLFLIFLCCLRLAVRNLLI